MLTYRGAFFLLGCVLMLIGIVLGLLGAWDHPRWGRAFLFDLGLLIAIAAHGWPLGGNQ
jgi:hypothetical protein